MLKSLPPCTHPSPHRPSGTSPKCDRLRLVDIKSFFVAFGGGWEGAELKPFRHVLAPHASQRIADLAEGDVILHAFNEKEVTSSEYREPRLSTAQATHQLVPYFSPPATPSTSPSVPPRWQGQRSGVRGSFLPSPGID